MNSPGQSDGSDIHNNLSASNAYMPQLDSLRAFAVLFVLIQHWLTDRTWLLSVPFGMIGVTLFFVLSGFLISKILLQSKPDAGVSNNGLFHILKQFYIRRTLRIFPIYYITLIILFILNTENIRDIFGWFVFYASNIYFYNIGDWAGLLSHLWTLAVEEQFYIIWPLLMLFTPRKHLLKVILIMIITGPLSRSVMFYFSDKSEMTTDLISILMPTCLDCFGLGALLAYLKIYSDKNFDFKGIYVNNFILINILFLFISGFMDENIYKMFFYRFSVSVVSLFLISKAANGFGGPLKRIFENKFVMYFGKISYSIYLFHAFIPPLYNYFKLPQFTGIYFRFFIQAAILTLLSSISWYIIEKPVINLKKKFKYQ
ncbi:MAG TPA: acyltransferase [Ignavibacteria bacterium]|nr:acyltransferase [Ignavibacteria bacterium]